MDKKTRHHLENLFKRLHEIRYEGNYGAMGCGAMDRASNRVLMKIETIGYVVIFSDNPSNDGYLLAIGTSDGVPGDGVPLIKDRELNLDFRFDEEVCERCGIEAVDISNDV